MTVCEYAVDAREGCRRRHVSSRFFRSARARAAALWCAPGSGPGLLAALVLAAGDEEIALILGMELSGERREGGNGEAEHGVLLDLRVRF
ncbi:MAG: hypothetical protein OXE53_01580 [Deltaproteobacteria bacterium]|nr:hypothetical protein [Deltaproteobacteria bacterium]